MDLKELGWNEQRNTDLTVLNKPDLLPARVLTGGSNLCYVVCANGELKAQISGKFGHDAGEKKDLPVVGDWVAIEVIDSGNRAIVHSILPRTSAFTRKEAGKRTEAQVIAANIDTVFLVSGLDAEYNLARIERYLTVAWESGAQPVIVLNKADSCVGTQDKVEAVQAIAGDIPVLPVSALENMGLDALYSYIRFGRTVAFLGSSGVGKSTLINKLLGADRQKVRDVRAQDSRGRHTTVSSELFILPDGGLLIDTPGMREIQLWDSAAGLSGAFEDIENLARKCRFNDCRHEKEPGCAVKDALADGRIDIRRYESYSKLRQELQDLAGRQDAKQKLVRKKKNKALAIRIKQYKKHKKS